MPELYPDAVEGPYTVPSDTDIADGPQAFRDFADSLGGLSDTLEVIDFTGDKTITPTEMGALFTMSDSFSCALTVLPDEHPVGSVFVVSNISDSADVVVGVETPNLSEAVGQYAIMSFTQVQPNVWVPNGGGAGGGGAVFTGSNATGGDSVYLVDDYNGSGLIYRVHEFSTDGTLSVTAAETDFRLMVVGGGAGGCGIYAGNGGISSGGEVYENATEALLVGDYSISIGAGGNGFGTNGSAADTGHGTSASATVFGGVITCAGGQHHTPTPNANDFIHTSDITGFSAEYACSTRGNSHGSGIGPINYGDAGVKSGIHPTGGPNNPSGPGKAGGVIVAYPITQAAPATRRA